VALNDLSIPSEISSFLNEFYQCSQLLTLKNDGLRRKFDSIKYDVKKVEGVVYDLAVRGLLKGHKGSTEMAGESGCIHEA
jgi:hypothetical protein